MNQVQLIGRMAREPELRRTEKGTPVVSFALAVDRRFQRDTVDFVDCVAWRGTAEFVNKYFRKGKRVALTGSIQVRKWKDKDGNDRKSVEVIADSVEFADGKDQGAGFLRRRPDGRRRGPAVHRGRRRRRRTSVLTHPRRKAVKRMDQNEKEEKRKAWVRFRVMDVLRNHDQEARAIESQIAAERAALAEDLKEILESAFHSSQLSDAGVRVQSSPDPDARMVNMVTRTEKRRTPPTAGRRPGTSGPADRRRPVRDPGHGQSVEVRPSGPVLPLPILQRSGRFPPHGEGHDLPPEENSPGFPIRRHV